MRKTAIVLVMGALLLGGCAGKASVSMDGSDTSTKQRTESAPAIPEFPSFERPRVEAEFPAYVTLLKQYAIQRGVEPEVVERAFANTHFIARVVKADKNQLEKKITLTDYLNRVLPAWKVKQAQQKYREYAPQLQGATSRFGVPERYIVALWAVESSFGKLQGKEDVISAMSSLAFEGRRETFFVNELMAALKIMQDGTLRQPTLKGSWAGAMGQCQFMPSSYLRYGADGDGDGYIDIWNNVSDVFASTANYLASEGWQPGVNWGREVTLPGNFDNALAGLENAQARPISEWQKMGVRNPDGSPLPAENLNAWIILPDDSPGRSFMVYNNFRVLMHWNRSYYFAISVGMLADSIHR